jgi:hypothetical protein
MLFEMLGIFNLRLRKCRSQELSIMFPHWPKSDSNALFLLAPSTKSWNWLVIVALMFCGSIVFYCGFAKKICFELISVGFEMF